MTQPHELTLSLPVELSNGVISSTDKVWDILTASIQWSTPLAWARKKEQHEIEKMLLNAGANIP